MNETRLLYADGQGSRQEGLLSPNKPRLVVGRSPRADVSLSWDPEVSQLHAILEWIGHYWVVNDDNMSRNGTFVNDERLTGSRRLHQGDMIRMGTTTIGFVGTLGVDEGVTNDGSKLGALQPLTSAETRVLIAMCRPYKNKAGFGNPASNQQIALRFINEARSPTEPEARRPGGARDVERNDQARGPLT